MPPPTSKIKKYNTSCEPMKNHTKYAFIYDILNQLTYCVDMRFQIIIIFTYLHVETHGDVWRYVELE